MKESVQIAITNIATGAGFIVVQILCVSLCITLTHRNSVSSARSTQKVGGKNINNMKR